MESPTFDFEDLIMNESSHQQHQLHQVLQPNEVIQPYRVRLPDQAQQSNQSHQVQRRFTASMVDIENSMALVPVNAARCHNLRCVQLDRDYKHQIANLLGERAKYMHIEVAIRDRELQVRSYKSTATKLNQQIQGLRTASTLARQELERVESQRLEESQLSSAALATAREDIQRLQSGRDAAKQATLDIETRMSKELEASKEKGRAWVIRNFAKIRLVEDRLAAAEQATYDMESTKNDELQRAKAAQQKYTEFELQTGQKMETLTANLAAARTEVLILENRQKEDHKRFKGELEVANRKTSEVETSKNEALHKAKADLDRALTKIKCLEDQLARDATTTSEVFRKAEQTLEDFRMAIQAHENQIQAARAGTDGMAESLIVGTQSDATNQDDGEIHAAGTIDRSGK